MERRGDVVGEVFPGVDECEYGVCGEGEVGDYGGDGDLFGGGDGIRGVGFGELWGLSFGL